MKVDFNVSAEEELFQAHAYYEAQQAGLGAGFVVEISQGLRQIDAKPDLWRMISPGRNCTFTPQTKLLARQNLVGSHCGVAERLNDVLAFQVGKIVKNLIKAAAGRDLADHHTHRDPHAPDARFTTHGRSSNAI